MNKNKIYERLKTLGQEAAEALGYELVDLEFKPGTDPVRALFYIYKEEGVSIDDCVHMSKALDKALEKEDLIPGAYHLEVSSPGLDRPLKTLDDYRRNKNKIVDIHLYAPIHGKKDFQGELVAYNQDEVVIKQPDEDEEITFPRKSISMMRQAIIF
ncbi:MAG: ribosome maturation factor RimP [Tissierellia bacterium]|nr:ribosome maturation factor RimP [Tissierellia bacterium]